MRLCVYAAIIVESNRLDIILSFPPHPTQAGCVFVQGVQAPAIAIMLPVIMRGLQDQRDAIVRRVSLIIENMCAVVADPKEAYPLLPKVLLMAQAALERTSDPEARAVVRRAVLAMQRLAKVLLFPPKSNTHSTVSFFISPWRRGLIIFQGYKRSVYDAIENSSEYYLT